jgi:hypothetical protein
VLAVVAKSMLLYRCRDRGRTFFLFISIRLFEIVNPERGRLHSNQHGEHFVNTTAFTDRQVTLLPSGCNDLIKTASRREFKRPSQYVREAILARLEADGLWLLPDGTNRRAA